MRVPFAQAIAGLLLGSCLTALPVLAAEPVWGADLDCAACHANEAVPADNATAPKANETASSTATGTKTEAQVESKADAQAKEEVEGEDEGETAQHLITIHAPLGCTTCHDDAKLPELHDGATPGSKMPEKLKKTNVSEELCLSCHGSYEELAELTEDCDLLTDDNGTTVHPHDLPDVADHDPITCTNCHVVHSKKTVEQTAPAKCLSCHHENVYECGTCH